MKIVVESEREKQELLDASKYIHSLKGLDANHSEMVYRLVHLYLSSDTIEVFPIEVRLRRAYI